MKKYIIHIISLALLTFFYGCSQEELQSTFAPGNGRTLTLTLTHARMESRATSAGVTGLNENVINRVDLFLYPTDKTGSDAVFSQTGITTFTSKEDGKVVIDLDVPMEAVEKLFPNGVNTCEAYAIVNRPEESAIPTKTDMASLKAISITSDLGTNQAQDEFVMDGHSTNITYANDAISGSIAADRSAAKITLTITDIENELTDEGGTKWTPLPDQMQVMFYNGVKTSQVNTASVPADGVYFNLVGENGRVFTGTNNAAPYNHAIPFYSYPSDWGKQTPDKEAHMVLMLPWEANNQRTNFYYEVPIDDINKKLVRNTYYQIKLVVGVLGSTELNDEIVKLTPTCILLNWGEEQINADLDKPKYLVVDEKQVKVYNKPDCKVEYDTSDPVSVQILSITKPNYKETTAKTDNIYTYKSGGTVLSQTNGFTLTAENGVLNLNHTLDNEISDGSFDYVPYTVKVKIYHTNAPTEYVEEVEFIQYPAVYVENSFNAGGNKVNKSDDDDDDGTKDGSEENGWVFVNSQTQSDYSGNNNNQSNYWYTVEGFDTSSKNPNMYIVTTTALDRSLNYILGDSRETTTYTYSQIGTGESKDINNATLQKYRPTKTDRDDYLSPKFRISSAYGQLGNNMLTLENAKKRCATYQEYGYPAGRWRLATKAELEYIAILCQFDALPISLFGASTYWGANNRYSIDTSDGKIEAAGSSGYAYLRCVYDDWYWGSTPLNDKTKFTWGDQKTTEELNALAK